MWSDELFLWNHATISERPQEAFFDRVDSGVPACIDKVGICKVRQSMKVDILPYSVKLFLSFLLPLHSMILLAAVAKQETEASESYFPAHCTECCLNMQMEINIL